MRQTQDYIICLVSFCVIAEWLNFDYKEHLDYIKLYAYCRRAYLKKVIKKIVFRIKL